MKARRRNLKCDFSFAFSFVVLIARRRQKRRSRDTKHSHTSMWSSRWKYIIHSTHLHNRNRAAFSLLAVRKILLREFVFSFLLIKHIFFLPGLRTTKFSFLSERSFFDKKSTVWDTMRRARETQKKKLSRNMTTRWHSSLTKTPSRLH